MNIFGLFSSLSFPLLLLSCEIQCKSEKSRRNKRRRMDSPRRFLDAHDPVDGGKLEPSFHCESIVGACGVAGSRKERQNKELSAELFPAENLYRSSPSVCQLSRLASLLAGYKFSFTCLSRGGSGDCASFLCILAFSTNRRCHRCVENSQIK